MRGIPLNIKQKTDIANLHLQGMTYSEIGAELGLSKNAVYRACKYDPEVKEILKDMQQDYKNELLDLTVDTMKEIMLNEDTSTGIKVTLIPTALKYCGQLTEKVEVKKEFNLDEFMKEFEV